MIRDFTRDRSSSNQTLLHDSEKVSIQHMQISAQMYKTLHHQQRCVGLC